MIDFVAALLGLCAVDLLDSLIFSVFGFINKA